MALIKCPECDNSVSDSATSCPHCGFPIEKHITKVQNKQKLENKARLYTKTINGYDVNLMELYNQNNQSYESTINKLVSITHIKKAEAREIMGKFYELYIYGTENANNYKKEINACLINENRDDFITCPHCGYNELDLLSEVESEGLSGSKLCCLTWLFGWVGLFCGLNKAGKVTTTHYYRCKKCGHKFKA